MPSMTYDPPEVEAAIRMGWVTGVRDVLVAMQGHALDDTQAAQLARFAADPSALRDTVLDVLRVGGKYKAKAAE